MTTDGDQTGRTTRAGRLARLGFADPSAAERDWQTIQCSEQRLLDDLAAAPDPDLAVRALARMVAAAGDGTTALCSALADNATLGVRLARVLGASTALGDHLARHPEDWQVLADPDLSRVRPTAAALDAQLAAATDRDSLRRIYRRLLLGLAARDLSLELGVEDAAAELADLATGALRAALTIAAAELPDDRSNCRLAVIGMGKCGGHELNYVSDVDVVFVAEPVDGADETRALRSATALAGRLMRVCSDHTAEGVLWEVDAGLRPEGKSGPLVRTLSSHESYYRRWAKTWEFQALLKARPLAGDEELGERYVGMTEPLVWSAADRPDFVPDLQAMRRRVVDAIPAAQLSRQIKLGPGGLRDVEFAVQLLQLVHGRSDATLRSPNTLHALESLTAGGYVGRDDGAQLTEAYRFLRTIEHRLQLTRLRRTQVLPEDPQELRVLGRSLGLGGDPAAELTQTWKRHRREVRRLHEKLFYRPLLVAVAALPGEEARLSAEAAQERMEALGYVDPASALRHLEALSSGVSRRAAIQRTLLPAMLGWFAEAPDPDGGLLGFRKLSEALGSSPWYLRMLRDEGLAAERVARLLATSRFASDLLMRAPEATALLAHDDDLAPRDTAALTHEAVATAGRQTDPIAATAGVRAMRRRELFRVAAADIFGQLTIDEVGRALTAVAAATVEGALHAAVSAVEAQRRTPLPTRIAVIGMGRLGGGEMSYSSDADVMFVHHPDADADEQDASESAFAVANEMRRLLSVPGPDPDMPIDADLRPEGRQGPLVRTLASYRAYYDRWSKVWEAQALLRAAPVAGDRQLGEDFVAMIDPLRYPAAGMTDDEIAEVRRIKARVDAERLPRGADPALHLKLGRGGLADVEWTVQLLQLRHAAEQLSLRDTSTLTTVEAAAKAGLLAAGDAEILAQAWLSASRIRNAAMLVSGRAGDSVPGEPRDRRGVAFLCGYPSDEVSRLIDDYSRATRRSSGVVERLFWEQ